METTIPKVQRVVISNDTVKEGDVIFFSSSPNSLGYTVMDVCLPFMMLENHKTHSCIMYRIVSPIYKEVLCQ